MKKYGKDGDYSAFYFPGKNWYASMAFVYDYGGQIAVRKGGKWKGTLNSPQAIRALTKLKAIGAALSRASKTGRRGEPAAGARLREGQGRLRSSATAGNGRTRSTRSSGIQPSRP